MPRTPRQFETIRRRTRARIVRAAAALFVEQGIHATTVADIARRAGVAVGLLYRHFKTKEELLATIVTDSRDRLETTIDALVAGRPHLAEFADALLSALKANRKRWRMLLAVLLQPQARKVLPKARWEFEARLADVVGRLAPTPSEHPAVAAGDIPRFLHAIVMTYLVTENETLARDLAAALFRRS